MSRYPFASRLAVLLIIDIAISVFYGFVPVELTLARSLLSYLQLAFMAFVMVYAIRRVLQDY